MKIRWLPEALRDIERLYAFLVEKNPIAAARAMEIIFDGAESLLDTPEIGQPMNDETERRQLYLPFENGAYVLYYRLDGDILVIIRVWHGREQRK